MHCKRLICILLHKVYPVLFILFCFGLPSLRKSTYKKQRERTHFTKKTTILLLDIITESSIRDQLSCLHCNFLFLFWASVNGLGQAYQLAHSQLLSVVADFYKCQR